MSPHAVPTKVCRGCAGTGIGQHVTPRQLQVIEAQQPITVERRQIRHIRITTIRDQPSSSAYFHGPLALAVEHLRWRLAEDWTPVTRSEAFVAELLEHWKDWRCEWCSGTGVPQLSVATMRGAR